MHQSVYHLCIPHAEYVVITCLFLLTIYYFKPFDLAILRRTVQYWAGQIERFGSRLSVIGSDWAVYVQIGRCWAGLGGIGPYLVILYRIG